MSDPPYLRRLQYVDHRGARVAVYTAAPLGLVIARQLFGRASAQPGQDVNARFLEHSVRLNDLYVALAQACARQGVTPERYPFGWISTDSGGLPWRERSTRSGQMEERRIIPDAVLEFPADRVRIFLECEMGGHHLVRRDEYALTSILGKLNRYAAFMEEGAHETFYLQKYPDRWRAELAFLLHAEMRAAKVSALIARWRTQNRAVSLGVTALSFPQAAAHFRARLRVPAPPEEPVSLDPADLRLTCSFVSQVAATYKMVRQYLRANPAIRAQGCPYPEYTPEFERMVALVERLRAPLGVKTSQ